jgi:hypothetical protein
VPEDLEVPPDVQAEVLAADAVRRGDLTRWRTALYTDPELTLDKLAQRIIRGASLLAEIDDGATLLRITGLCPKWIVGGRLPRSRDLRPQPATPGSGPGSRTRFDGLVSKPATPASSGHIKIHLSISCNVLFCRESHAHADEWTGSQPAWVGESNRPRWVGRGVSAFEGVGVATRCQAVEP